MALSLEKYLDPVEPEEAVPEYIYEDVDLGGESWNYRLFWNDRSERYQIDIWPTPEEALAEDETDKGGVTGKKLVPNYPIAWANTGRKPPNGSIMLLDTGDPQAREQCTYEGLGHRWKLCWIADDGVAATEDSIYTITVP
jgi:hypothetical protein